MSAGYNIRPQRVLPQFGTGPSSGVAASWLVPVELQDCVATLGPLALMVDHELSYHKFFLSIRADDPFSLALIHKQHPDHYRGQVHAAVRWTHGGWECCTLCRLACVLCGHTSRIMGSTPSCGGYWYYMRGIIIRVGFPLKGVLPHCHRQCIKECSIKPLDEAVRLWMVQCCSRLDNSKELTHLSNNVGLEVAPLVQMELLWWREAEEKFVYELTCHRAGILIWKWVCLSPPSEVIGYH